MTAIISRSRLTDQLKHQFAQHFAGTVLRPELPAYDDARKVWNGMIDRHPALIAQPNGVEDVQKAVTFAAAQDLALSIKGGGHNVAGLAVAEGGLMLDLSAMRRVTVDPNARVARIQGGATWADVDGATAPHGLATTGGVISSTGVAGLTLGGGIGWLVGKHGLTVDNLLSAEVITASGELVRASATEHTDLFWALRGGGGNFGVVTEFAFALHPLTDVLAGMMLYPIDQIRDGLKFYREFTASAPDELTTYFQAMTDPESSEPIFALAICWPGDLAEGERVIAPLVTFGEPLANLIEVMPYVTWQVASDAEFPHGHRYYWKSHLLSNLPDGVMDALVAACATPPHPRLTAVIEHYTGAMNRVPVEATAYPHRNAHYQLVLVGGTDDPAEDAIIREWVRALHAATAPYGLATTFHNFNSLDAADPADRTRIGFGPNWDRLVQVKRQYDSTNLFRHNHNVTP